MGLKYNFIFLLTSNLIVIPCNEYLLESNFCLQVNWQSLSIKASFKLIFLNSALRAIKKEESYYFRILFLEILQVLEPVARWGVDAFWCSRGIHWDSRIPNKTGAFLRKKFYLQYTFICLAFFIRICGGFLLKCITLHYRDVNLGNENWGEDISENENNLKTLHEGGN